MSPYEARTIFAKEGNDIHYFAYGYYSEGAEDAARPYRFVEYTFFIVPIEEVLKLGFYNYESEYGCDYKQYVMDVDEETMIHYYQTYDNGNPPKFVSVDDINKNLPDGVYIAVPSEEAANIPQI